MEQLTASLSDIPTLCKCFQENVRLNAITY